MVEEYCMLLDEAVESEENSIGSIEDCYWMIQLEVPKISVIVIGCSCWHSIEDN